MIVPDRLVHIDSETMSFVDQFSNERFG